MTLETIFVVAKVTLVLATIAMLALGAAKLMDKMEKKRGIR